MQVLSVKKGFTTKDSKGTKEYCRIKNVVPFVLFVVISPLCPLCPSWFNKEATMSNLNTALSQLDQSWKALSLRWEETKKVWTDLVRHDFEKTYWEPLTPQPPAVGQELERLAQVIAGAKRSVK